MVVEIFPGKERRKVGCLCEGDQVDVKTVEAFKCLRSTVQTERRRVWKVRCGSRDVIRRRLAQRH